MKKQIIFLTIIFIANTLLAQNELLNCKILKANTELIITNGVFTKEIIYSPLYRFDNPKTNQFKNSRQKQVREFTYDNEGKITSRIIYKEKSGIKDTMSIAKYEYNKSQKEFKIKTKSKIKTWRKNKLYDTSITDINIFKYDEQDRIILHQIWKQDTISQYWSFSYSENKKTCFYMNELFMDWEYKDGNLMKETVYEKGEILYFTEFKYDDYRSIDKFLILNEHPQSFRSKNSVVQEHQFNNEGELTRKTKFIYQYSPNRFPIKKTTFSYDIRTGKTYSYSQIFEYE